VTSFSTANTKNPDAEALQVTYDPSKITYTQLLEFFFKMHDPTTVDQQGPDRGSQYRSAIFTHSDSQKEIAESITKKVSEQWWRNKICTQIIPAGEWYSAEDYHQRYLDVNPGGYECPSHYLRTFPPLK
jgi:peptide-methionine (S)-S-oxide reductase